MTHVSDDKLDDAARLAELDANEPGHGVASATYASLLITQMLGAINDNVFRWLAIGIGKGFVDEMDQPFASDALMLSAGLACFVLPYLLFAAPAGYLADRFSKRDVIVCCKMAEIVIMLLGILAIWIGNLYLLFGIVALMGTQSALFGPAKLGSIPEMLNSRSISLANGVLGLTTVIATVIGAAGGNLLHDFTAPRGEQNLWAAVCALIGVAVLGLVSSFGIMKLPAANPLIKFPWNAPLQTWRDMMIMCEERAMLRVALGIAFFWTLGSLCQLNIDQFALEGMPTLQETVEQTHIIPLLVALIVGVGLGSVLAGIWSGGHVELGILPLGAFGIAFSSIMLFTVDGSLVTEQITAAGEEFKGTDQRLWAC
ncbi:MAG: MFS transporter, partial [Pirellulales bacterium]